MLALAVDFPLGGVWWPASSAATCHPKKATLALAEQAKQSGVNILEHTEVSDLNSQDDRKKWKVTYRILKDRLDDPEDHLEIESDVVILAAGSWCSYLGELAGVSIPVIPVLGLMWSTSIQKTNQVKTLIGSMESSTYWHLNPSENEETPPRTTHKFVS